MSRESKNRLPLRPDKAIDWLRESRDDWKEKNSSNKAALKVARQAQKRALAGRKQWKELCKELQKGQVQDEIRLKAKEEEIAKLNTKIIQLNQENEVLKKKSWLALKIHG